MLLSSVLRHNRVGQFHGHYAPQRCILLTGSSPLRWANVSCTANFSLGGHPVGCDHLSATRIQAPEDQKAALLSLEAAVIEIQSATILGDCPHDLLRRTVRYVGLYFQSQLHVRSQQAC